MVVMDFTTVRSVSSSTIGFLVALKKQLEKSEGRLKICCIGEKVANTPEDRYMYEIFKVVKLDKFFDIYDCVEEAIKN